MTPLEALEKAVEACGGQSALAQAISKILNRVIRQGHVWKWLQSGQVPPEYCPAIESASGVRCEDLHQDVEWQRNKAGRVTGYLVRVEQQAA